MELRIEKLDLGVLIGSDGIIFGLGTKKTRQGRSKGEGRIARIIMIPTTKVEKGDETRIRATTQLTLSYLLKSGGTHCLFVSRLACSNWSLQDQCNLLPQLPPIIIISPPFAP